MNEEQDRSKQLTDHDITERVRAEEALERYAHRLEILREIDQAILAAQSPEEIVNAALSRLRQLIPCRRASVALFDFETHEATVLAVHTDGETELKQGECLPLDIFGIDIGILQQGQTQVVEDIQTRSHSQPMDRVLQVEGLKSYISAPLIAQGNLIGSLNLGAEVSGALTPEHAEIAREVANSLAVALQDAQVKADLEQSVFELQNLQTITQALLELEALPRVMNIVAEGIATRQGYDIALVMRYYVEAEQVFTGLALHPKTERVDQLLTLIDRSELKGKLQQHKISYQPGVNQVIDRVLAGETEISASLADFLHPWVPRPVAETIQRRSGVQTYINLPMSVKGRTVGAILAGVREGPITAGQQRALARVAHQVAIAVENARLYETSQRRSRELATFAAVAQAANRHIEIDPLLNQVLPLLADTTGASAAWVTLLDENRDFVLAAAHNLPPMLKADNCAALRWSGCTCQRKLLSGELTSAANILNCDRWQKVQGDTHDPHYHAAVPLHVRGQVLGNLNLMRAPDRVFSDDELDLLSAVGDQIGVAIERVRKHQAAKAAEARYRNLFDGVPVGLYQTTPGGQILDVNTALVQMLGYPDREILLATNVLDVFVDEEDRR